MSSPSPGWCGYWQLFFFSGRKTFKLEGLNNLPHEVLKLPNTLCQNNLGWWALVASLASFPFSKRRDICLPRCCFSLQRILWSGERYSETFEKRIMSEWV